MEEGRIDVAQDDRAFFFNLAGETGQILNATAKWLSTEDEKNFRLVSRFFFKSSLPSWRSKTRLKINASSQYNRGEDNLMNQEVLTPDEAVRLTEGFDHEENEQANFLRLHKDPYHSIAILNWFCNINRPDHANHDQSITTIFRRMSTALKHIVFQTCEPIDLPQFVRTLTECCNLISVVFTNCSSSWAENAHAVRIMAKHLTIDPLPDNVPRNFRTEDRPWLFFNHFPVLQTLTLHLESLVNRVNRGFIQGLRNYRDNINNNSIRLQIVGIATFEGTITEFLEAAIPIENWIVFFITPATEDELRERSLKLMKLTVDKTSGVPWIPAFPFQVGLPSLTQLYLFGKVTNSFEFLRFMPAVQRVIVLLYSQEELAEVNSTPNEDRTDNLVRNMPDENRFDEMKNLTYLDTDCYLDLDGLRVLRVKAPGLIVLETVLRNNEMFQFVCDEWKMLIALTLYPGSEVDDNVIPNLTKLKNLAYFKIWNSRVLTDVSVNDGFLRMERLSELYIHCATNISESCKELLRAGLRNVKFCDGAQHS